MKILWLDTETTGLNKEKCDIIQLSGIVVIDGEERERFDFHCQPINYENIEPASFEKTKLSIEKLKEFQTPQEMYVKFIQLLDKYIDKYDRNDKFFIAGQNVRFDVEFLQSFFNKMGDQFLFSYFRHQTIDLMYFCTILHTAGLIKLDNFRLETIVEYLDVKFEGDLHNAFTDVDLTRKCFCKLFKDFIKF